MSEKMTGKSKSMGRIIGKIALWLVIGGALGFFGAFLIFSIKGETENVMHLFFNGYLAYALWYQIGFFIVLGGIAVTLYFRAGAQIKLGNYEAEDRAGEYQNAAITANELNMVIQFLLFGLAVDGKNPMMLANVVCFLVCCTVVVVMEAFLVKQVKMCIRDRYREEPFFLYFPMPAPHTPILPASQFCGKSGTNEYGDFVLHCDDVAGRINRKLKELGFMKIRLSYILQIMAVLPWRIIRSCCLRGIIPAMSSGEPRRISMKAVSYTHLY